MDNKLKTNLYISGGVILLIAGISYYFYRVGKKSTTIAKLPESDIVDIDPNEPNKPKSSTGMKASTSQLLTIATALYNDMQGFNWSGHDPKPYMDAVGLADIDFVRLYNLFNAKYQQESGETLTEWFNNETYVFLGDKGGSVYLAFLNKLNKLNLK